MAKLTFLYLMAGVLLTHLRLTPAEPMKLIKAIFYKQELYPIVEYSGNPKMSMDVLSIVMATIGYLYVGNGGYGNAANDLSIRKTTFERFSHQYSFVYLVPWSILQYIRCLLNFFILKDYLYTHEFTYCLWPAIACVAIQCILPLYAIYWAVHTYFYVFYYKIERRHWGPNHVFF